MRLALPASLAWRAVFAPPRHSLRRWQRRYRVCACSAEEFEIAAAV